LTTNICPECGVEVPKRHSWALSLPAPTGGAAQAADSASPLPASSSTRSA
jgi:hypothetical protein